MKVTNLHQLTGIVLAALLLAGCGKQEYREEEREIGYKGEARLNPFLAAERLLDRYHYDTSTSTSITRLPDHNSAVIIPGESIPSKGSAMRFRRWVERGGHLIYIVSGTEPKGSFFFDFEEPEHPLLDEFEIGLSDRYSDENDGTVTVISEDLEVKMGSDYTVASEKEYFPMGQRPDILMDEPKEARILSMPVGAGRFTVLCDAGPIRNRNIGEGDHARFLVELIEIQGHTNTVMFIYGSSGPSFWGMLWHYGWMPLVGLLLLTVLWIWKNLPRYGPIIPHKIGGTMQFTEHIDMSGRFLWRHKASAALLAPIRTFILRDFLKRNLHEGVTDVEYFTENSDLNREEVSEALQSNSINDPATMTRIVKNLKHLKDKIYTHE